MRISDWSSDVCSSDLGGRRPEHRRDFLKFVDDFDGITAIDVRKGIEARRAAVRIERIEQQHLMPEAFAPSRRFLPILLFHVENDDGIGPGQKVRSEEHTSELQSLMRISYAVFCLKKKNK